MEILLFYIFVTFLVIMQTIAGVGVLVLGTPLMLIFNYQIIELINILLPISILTSLINYLYLKQNKKNFKIKLDQNIKKTFIFIFLPSISIGLILVKEFNQALNFKILVSSTIMISLIIKWKFQPRIEVLSISIKKFIVAIIGVIHGLSNSGGTLLTIFFTILNKNKKNQSRYSITFYYLIFVFTQYMIFLVVFEKRILSNFSLEMIFLIIFGSLIGNYLVKKISEIFFQRLIEALALFSAIVLLIS